MMNQQNILALLLLLFLNSCGYSDDFNQLSHGEFLKDHEFNIGQTTIELQDTIRDRPVKMEIWYPTQDTTQQNITKKYPFKLPPTSKDAKKLNRSFPLILFSHGTGGNRISQMWLACELVGNGYVVVAVNHYGNTMDNKIPENFVRVWDRPLDISFALDYLLSSKSWVKKIDENKIGMVGFSLGGYTSIALAGAQLDYDLLKKFSNTDQGKNEFYLPELGDVSKYITSEIIKEGYKNSNTLKDDRISAFVAMSPALGQGFNSAKQFENIEDSILIFGAQKDKRTPIETNAKHYHKLIDKSHYIELKGNIGHYIFMNQAKEVLKREAPLIFRDDESIERKQVHENVSKEIVGFFNFTLSKQ